MRVCRAARQLVDQLRLVSKTTDGHGTDGGPNEVTHNSLIDAFGRQTAGGDSSTPGNDLITPSSTVLDSCLGLLRQMIERDGLTPSARTLTGLTYAIGRGASSQVG